ncbi:MAG: putative rane protein [Frankiales bacterium]|nr:putative rane protein [Frankiales bacterium]
MFTYWRGQDEHVRRLLWLPLVVATACTATTRSGPTNSPPATTPAVPSRTAAATAAGGATPDTGGRTSSPSPATGPVVVRYRVERRTSDPATAGFAGTVVATLSDARGWQRGDVRLVHDQRATYRVLLVEPAEAERLCRPYDVYRKYSCQNGPLVVLNAERWRHATNQWTGTLPAYRQMLVNHEFGHLLGLHHPSAQCARGGTLAPVMAQQSTELGSCLPNPWPLGWEVALLARHTLPLAPPAH